MDNGTRIFSAASSSNTIRGKSVDLMLVDEFAFIDDNMADKFMQGVFPTQAAKDDAMLILISTPKGMNHFYDIWVKAKAGKNSFIPCKVQWNEIEGRDQAWLDAQIRDHGQLFVAQEYCCLGGDEKVSIKHKNGKINEIKLKNLYKRLKSINIDRICQK